jgi:hypothetical protein
VAQDSDGDGYVSIGTGGSDCDDGNPARSPDAPEVCDAQDNDCDTLTDEELGLGDSCTTPGNCVGSRRCLQDGGVDCDAPPPTLTRFPDGDNDGFGARDAGSVSFCTAPVSGYSTVNTDCDDANPGRYPSAFERCDGVDDNCNGLLDEGLDLGASCTPDGGCTGKRSCNGQGAVYCEPLTLPTLYFPDEDRDTYGEADAGSRRLCGTPPPGMVTRGNDCDDGDPFTFPTARELCDVKDNDCDGLPEDAGVCPSGGPKWSAVTLGDPNFRWRSVSLWGDGGVWTVGRGNRRAVKPPGVATFSYLDDSCPGNWLASWADPVTGRAYFGGEGGELAIQEATEKACVPLATVSDTVITGLSFLPGQSGPDFHGVGGDDLTTPTVGRTFTWDGGTQVSQGASVVAPLNDVHGLSRQVLFAAGGYNNSPRVYRFDAGTGGWQTEGIEAIPTANSPLEAVWVVNDRLAYAVGGGGTVLRWDGSEWGSIRGPSTERLMSVVAFGRNSVYVTTSNGKIYRSNGATWQQQLPTFGNDILYDIAATSPEDIWVVGANGRIIHWPQ